MSLLKRVSALFAAAACCWLCLAGRADAQGVTPTPEMLQIFQGLTPEQQQAILGAVTGGASGGSGGGLSSLLGGGGTGDRSKDLQAVQADRRQQKQQAEQVTRPSGSDEEEADAATSQLRAQDWVIVEIDYPMMARSAAPAGALANQLQSLNTAHDATTQAAQAAVLAASGTPPPSLATSPASSGTNAAANRGAQNELPDEERARLDALMTLIRSRNPYQLTREGALLLPGFPTIALLGLTEEQATLRLKVEPALRGLEVKLTRLPLKKTGVEGLLFKAKEDGKPFVDVPKDDPPLEYYASPAAAVEFEHSDSIRFAGNILSHLGGAGIRVDQYSANIEVDLNTVTDVSSNGVIIGSPNIDFRKEEMSAAAQAVRR